MADWIPIALGRDVPAGVTRAVIVEGRELVIWRGDNGVAQVWEDRCPHRGMRLSLGFVRGNALNCLYHGWEYGTGAQCLRIPAHPDLTVPPTIRASAYASTEAGGMIWMSVDAEDAPPALPDLAPVLSLAIDAAPALALAPFGGADNQLIAVPLFDGTLHIGWHPVHAEKTMLHATTSGSDVGAAIRHLRAQRHGIEQGAAA